VAYVICRGGAKRSTETLAGREWSSVALCGFDSVPKLRPRRSDNCLLCRRVRHSHGRQTARKTSHRLSSWRDSTGVDERPASLPWLQPTIVASSWSHLWSTVPLMVIMDAPRIL